jgi:ABC-type dipeptide/oligopeptide/nickel transport system ATPase component
LLFLTHNLPRARSIAHDVVVMHEWAICEQGAVSDVLRAPKDPYPAQLLADAPKMTVAVDG